MGKASSADASHPRYTGRREKVTGGTILGKSRILKNIRKKVRENFFIITPEAMAVMEEDFLSMDDVKHAIENGQIDSRILRESSCGRYEFYGYELCGPVVFGMREVHMDCEMVDSGKLIITEVYAK